MKVHYWVYKDELFYAEMSLTPKDIRQAWENGTYIGDRVPADGVIEVNDDLWREYKQARKKVNNLSKKIERLITHETEDLL